MIDEQVRFYLRHREQLEEWLNLRDRAAAAVDDWLSTLSAGVASMASQLNGDVRFISDVEDRSWPSFYLKRSAWPGETLSDTAVLIGLQWERRGTLLLEDSAPYVGVRSERASPVSRGLRDDPAFQDRRREAKHQTSQYWPAWRYVVPIGAFPEEAEGYKRDLINSMHDMWNMYAPLVDRVVAST